MYEKEVLKNNNPFNVGIVFLEPLLPYKEFEKMKKLDEEMKKLDEEMKSKKYRLFLKFQVIYLELFYLYKKIKKYELKWKMDKNGLKLDFDANACSYLLLQMNQIQNLFVFQVIVPSTCIILPIKPIKENIDIHCSKTLQIKF